MNPIDSQKPLEGDHNGLSFRVRACGRWHVHGGFLTGANLTGDAREACSEVDFSTGQSAAP